MNPWDAWRQASCMPDHCFCEAVSTGLVRQPSNTIGSGAFVVVSLVVLAYARTGDARVTVPSLSGVHRFAIAVALVGVGSAFFHSSLTFWGQTADVLGMYLLATHLLLASVVRRVPLSARAQRAWYVAGNGMLLSLLVLFPAARRYAFAALVLAIVWSEWRNRTRGVRVESARWLIAAVGVLAAGFAVWAFDLTHVWCDPSSPWQGHAVWHVCGAASAWLAFRYFMQPPVTPLAS